MQPWVNPYAAVSLGRVVDILHVLALQLQGDRGPPASHQVRSGARGWVWASGKRLG